MKITVHIDRVVLEGLTLEPTVKARLGDSINHEIAGLLSERAPHRRGAVGRIEAPPILLGVAESSDEIARSIARSAHTAMMDGTL
jgi:hypothetical protein